MGFYENGFSHVTALCIGVASVAFGGFTTGAIEASVGIAGLTEFVLRNRKKFGPENDRVRKQIQKSVFDNYKAYLHIEGENWSLKADLEAANQALSESLGNCFIDRNKLAKLALTPKGFRVEAVTILIDEFGTQRADLFGKDKKDTLPYQYAHDVIKAGIEAAVQNKDYYAQLEPELMFEMARALGEVRQDVKDTKKLAADIPYIKKIVEEIQLNLPANQRNASESDLIQLVGFILEKPIARENIVAEVERAYEKLKELRAGLGDLRSLANEAPEIMPLLEEADRALNEGAGFSLDKAESALEKADMRYMEIISEREEQVKIDKENRAKILGKRADIAEIKFQYSKAVELYRQQSKLFEDCFGKEHPDTATSYNNVASNLNAQGRYQEAEPLYRQGLEILERVLGKEHPDTATSYNNVAYNLNAQGRYEEAEPLLRQGLEILERVLGKEHPLTATSYNNVASNLNAQGRYEEAEPLYRQGLEIRERVLGKEHPLTATSYNNVAYNLNAQGRYAEAEPLYRQALEICERVLSKEHPNSKVIRKNWENCRSKMI